MRLHLIIYTNDPFIVKLNFLTLLKPLLKSETNFASMLLFILFKKCSIRFFKKNYTGPDLLKTSVPSFPE